MTTPNTEVDLGLGMLVSNPQTRPVTCLESLCTSWHSLQRAHRLQVHRSSFKSPTLSFLTSHPSTGYDWPVPVMPVKHEGIINCGLLPVQCHPHQIPLIDADTFGRVNSLRGRTWPFQINSAFPWPYLGLFLQPCPFPAGVD